MNTAKQIHPWIAVAALLGATHAAHATNGYFSAGYGARSQGMAGIGVALPQDALAAAANPAGTALVGDRADLGAAVFLPRREAQISGNAFGADATYDGNGTSTFIIPDFGYTRQLDAKTGVGIAVYGNGGMNTDYGQNPYARFGATGSAGVNLEQLFITPSIARKISDNHTVGLALNIAYQRFSAKGIGAFGGFSTAPGQLSDQGTDSSTGVGVRIGWLGQLTPQLTLGASWSSRIHGHFSRYQGLFPNGGDFDIPENAAIGATYAVTPDTTLAVEAQQIRYASVAAVGDSVAGLFAGQPLGSAGGPGFGWNNVNVLKLGVQHRVSQALTLRAGVSFANQPVPASETFFNMLAPGVVQNHLTLGATWTAHSGDEWAFFYVRGFGKTVNGVNSIPPGMPPAGMGGGNASVSLQENIIGLSYSWKF